MKSSIEGEEPMGIESMPPETVLVVEDDEGLNRLVRKALKRAGFRTEGVLTGAGAVERVAADPRVVLLLDQKLPDFTGTELIRTLALKGLSVPFVAMTGRGDERVAVEMMKLGAKDYLVKGFDLTDLLPGVFERVFRELETARRLARAEKELAAREEKYKLLFNSGNDAIFVIPIKDGTIGKFIEVNDIACSSLGYTREELIGMTPEDIDGGGNMDRCRDCLQKIMETGNCVFNTEHRTKSGNNIPVEVSCRMFEDKGDTFVLSVARDIGERLKAENALRESEEKYRSMMEAMDDAAYICSHDFHIEYMNPAMIRRIGRDAVGELCHNALRDLDDKCPGCSHAKVMAGEFFTMERVTPEDGKTYHVSNSPIFHTDGTISKLTIFRDVTEFKKMESRILQAQKMESIGALAGGIAHDFNNILFPIVGFSEMLGQDLPKGSKERNKAREINKAAMRAAELVKQILSFSRQVEHRKVTIRVQQVLKEVVKLMRSSIPSNIRIVQSVQKDCDPVKADPTQLHQIAMNLVTNAYHAVEKNGGEISLGVEQRLLKGDAGSLSPGTYAVLSVRDTGHGIPPALLDKIFEPYFTTKPQGKGTGLGLSVVYGIVKDHGGDIRVESAVDKGTVMEVFLPIPKTPDKPDAPPRETVIYETGTERILLVDDEEAIVRFEKQMLERLGYRVTAKTRGVDALEAFKTEPEAFDLIITDMAMPDMTGDRLAEELISVKPDIRIIICTGFSEQIDPVKAGKMGIKGFLMKPVVKDELARTVRSVLEQT